MPDAKRTPLYDFHVKNGGKIVPFAGYELPVQYPMGVMEEHHHTRRAAGLFDVSHMGQIRLTGNASEGLERLVPMDIKGLGLNRQRYAFFTNEAGGILDDLMVANRGDHLFLVVNAACKDADFAHLSTLSDCTAEMLKDRALLALQGPLAEAALATLNSDVRDMRFMDVADLDLGGIPATLSRSGYSGEDGFEISVPGDAATALAEQLCAQDAVAPVGLGARDSLRLEAGLCLYGNDIDTSTTPVEAALTWAIQKRRRAEGGFPGADVILAELANGAQRKRVGLRPEGRAPMRAGTQLFATETDTESCGQITSGGFGPSAAAPVSMGYVPAALASSGTTLYAELRKKRLPVTVADMPFHPTSYKR